MARKSNLAEIIGEVVDKRTSFGQNVLEYADHLRGPRIIAFKNLMAILKNKGLVGLDVPVEFVFEGYEAGEKHERVGTTAAGQKARYVYRFSLRKKEAKEDRLRAGEIKDVGQTGQLGEIIIGKKLKKWLPVFFQSLGDERYAAFLNQSARQQRSKEVESYFRELIAKFVGELEDRTASEFPDLETLLVDFLEPKLSLERGSDLYWLKRQVENRKIDDAKLAKAIVSILEIPEYSNEDAQLAGRAILELRKRPIRGLIGSLKDDLFYLEENEEISKKVYPAGVELDRSFSRQQYYPERKQIEDGTIKEKLAKKQLTGSEALGIIRAFPKFIEAKQDFNRQNAHLYFRTDKEGIANLNAAIEKIAPYLDGDRKEYHEARKAKRKPELVLKSNYRLAKEISEISQLDSKKGRWGNLVSWLKMRNSKKAFSGLCTLANQISFIETFKDEGAKAGVMETSYENVVDFKARTGIDLKDAVKRICVIELPAEKRKSSRVRKYKEFRAKNAEHLRESTRFNLVPARLTKQLKDSCELVKDYEANAGKLKQKTLFLAEIEKCGLGGLESYLNLEALAKQEFLSPEQLTQAEKLYSLVLSNPDLKVLQDAKTKTEIAEKYQQLKANAGKRVYYSEKVKLAPARLPFEQLILHDFLDKDRRQIVYSKPSQIRILSGEMKTYISGAEILRKTDRALVQKLRAISGHTNQRYHNLDCAREVKVRKVYLDEFAEDLERNPNDVLVSKEMLVKINRVYRIIKDYESKHAKP